MMITKMIKSEELFGDKKVGDKEPLPSPNGTLHASVDDTRKKQMPKKTLSSDLDRGRSN